MLLTTTTLATALILANGVPMALGQLPVRVISFNIRYAKSDIDMADPEKPWLGMTCATDPKLCRAPGVIGTMLEQAEAATGAGAIPIIGLQESLDGQLNDIQFAFSQESPGWNHIGVARDDGKSAGEYNPIFYRSDLVELVYNETKWLSETPDVPGSKSWGSGCVRIATLGVFDDIKTRRRFIHINTHLDNASPEARVKQVGVVNDHIQMALNQFGTDVPVSLTGDFNSRPGDEASQALAAAGLVEPVYGMLPPDQRIGPDATFTGYLDQFSSRIDYVWVGPKTLKPYTANKYTILDNIRDDVKISDHRPVIVDLTMK